MNKKSLIGLSVGAKLEFEYIEIGLVSRRFQKFIWKCHFSMVTVFSRLLYPNLDFSCL